MFTVQFMVSFVKYYIYRKANKIFLKNLAPVSPVLCNKK